MPYTYEYPRPSVSVDLVAFRTGDSGRELLLIKRKNEPYAGQWALPGGFMDEGETLEQAAARELMEETTLSVDNLEQIKAYSKVDRDPRTRVISVAFLADLAPNQIPKAADDAADVNWFPIGEMPELAFDHAQIIQDALERLQGR